MNETPMLLCHQTSRLLDFCNRHPIAYRHLVHDLELPCLELDAQGHPISCDFYVDKADEIHLLAEFRNQRLRLEGDPNAVSANELTQWCRQLEPVGVATTSEPFKDILCDVVGAENWICFPTYTVTNGTFAGDTAHDVVPLLPEDRPAYDVFLQRTAGAGRHPKDETMASEFELMCRGSAIECFGVRVHSEIAGVVTIRPVTGACDEVSRLVVVEQYRGQGLAKSLLSVATRIILKRGRQPSYVAGGDRQILHRMLTGLGYELACHFWQRRYW